MSPDQEQAELGSGHFSDDVNERYAGERVPPFWGIDGVNEMTGEPLESLPAEAEAEAE